MSLMLFISQLLKTQNESGSIYSYNIHPIIYTMTKQIIINVYIQISCS